MMAKEGAYRQTADGRCAQIGEQHAVTDHCAIGEALLYAYKQTGDEALGKAYDKLLHWALSAAPRNDEGIVFHLDNSRQFWVDSFYMLPPFLASAGKYSEALKQINGYWKALFRPEKALLSHIWDDGEKRYIREDVWGVGNGWAAAGMARVISLLPAAYNEEKEELASHIRTLLKGALVYQRRDGLFHDVMDDPGTFVETNAAQMLAYVIFRGCREGYLDDGYIPAAQEIYYAVHEKVNLYGLVTDVCGAPSFDAPGVAPEGQAFFILMDSARRNGGFDKI